MVPINMCKTGVMSTCSVKNNILQQRNCKYFEKRTESDDCRFLTFGEYCWHPKAQKEAWNEVKKEK
jgi:hypothetical protein